MTISDALDCHRSSRTAGMWGDSWCHFCSHLRSLRQMNGEECHPTLSKGAWYSNLSSLGRDCKRRMRISVISILINVSQIPIQDRIRFQCHFGNTSQTCAGEISNRRRNLNRSKLLQAPKCIVPQTVNSMVYFKFQMTNLRRIEMKFELSSTILPTHELTQTAFRTKWFGDVY
jgi:hypothetical protein